MSTTEARGEAPRPGPFTPAVFQVVRRDQEAPDVVTLALQPRHGRPFDFAPGQFNMLTAFGVGEVPISVSQCTRAGPDAPHHPRGGRRDAGTLPCPPGVAHRRAGPFGTDWGIDDFAQSDAVVVAGGIGLAPLRGAVQVLLERVGLPAGPRSVVVLVGARTPDQLIFRDRPARLGINGCAGGYDGGHGLRRVEGQRRAWSPSSSRGPASTQAGPWRWYAVLR